MPQIGAPSAWEVGHTGEGVKVAVPGTGIDGHHPERVGGVVAEKNFSGASSGTVDRFGHGTHVASIITGGAACDAGYKEVAPDAGLLNGKVLDDQGSGSCSSILAGMQRAVEALAGLVGHGLVTDAPGQPGR